MNGASLRVLHAGPHVSFQDGGRFGNMRFGVPASGPMDRLAHAAANVVLGNDPGATAIEVSVGGLTLECVDRSVTISIVGGDFAVTHRDTPLPSSTVLTLRRGDRLSIRAGVAGSWTYLAIAGIPEVVRWLGHSATHSMSGFGGGQLHQGQNITIGDPRREDRRLGDVPRLSPPPSTTPVRVVIGPQDQHFEAGALSALATAEYAFTDAYDRMGVRLSGPPLELRSSLSIPSEPIVRGSIQVAGDAVPTVLFADHQTTGGYPKIATVISADLDSLTQRRPGDIIRFAPITPAEAIAVARRRAVETADYLALLAQPGRTLAHRLMHENLIGTHHSFDDD